MTQKRDLVPVTVYVPVAAKAVADRRAASESIATAALLRRIILGKAEPLRLISEATVEAVRRDADIVAVVRETTPLRKAGNRYQGRCPFHDERTPSFSVNPTEKLYHCFGCGKGGDVVGFVRDVRGLDFVGAVEWLANRFGIPVGYEGGPSV